MLYGELPTIRTEAGELQGVRINVPNPPKTAILRLPTNQEMLDRMDLAKTIRRSLGRRKSQNETVPNLKADLDLFHKLRIDKGEEFDEFEAANAISKLTSCGVIESERSGDEYKITLKTPFGNTVHFVKIPTQRDLAVYRRTVISVTDLPHGMEELRWRIEPAIDLYHAVVNKFEGYKPGPPGADRLDDVPPHHKSAVVVELANVFDDELELSQDPNS